MRRAIRFLGILSLLTAIPMAARLVGQEPTTKPTLPPAKPQTADDPAAPYPGLRRLVPDYEVWIDPAQKQVLMTGKIVLRRGPLELFACLKNSKEHESIVAVDTKAYIVHAALLAIGAVPGNPARFQPEFQPARGTEVEITVEWTDEAGAKKRIDARQWLRNVRTGKPLDFPWVFGGSGFWTDPADGKQYYQAEEGDFICISNFSTAMLDLPVSSPQQNAQLMFEAFTDHIPPDDTKVLLILKPKAAKPGEVKPVPPQLQPAAPTS